VTEQALSGFRVVELGRGAALAYCGKLFADLGATVIKVEPPAGDPDRRARPCVDRGDGVEESAVFAWLNTNKKSVTAAAEDIDRLLEIAGSSDVLLDSRPGAGWDPGPAGQAAIRGAFPHLTIVSLSWFGESGPYRDFVGTDSVVRALAGLLKSVGPPEAPAMQPQHQAGLPAALSAFTAAAAALLGGGVRGRRFEVSLHEANVAIAEYPVAAAVHFASDERRWGRNRFYPIFPAGIFPCRDGWLGVTALTNDQWLSFCDLFGMAAQAQDPILSVPRHRLERAAELEAIFRPKLLTRSAHEWFEETKRRRLPIVVVPRMADLLACQVHRDRGAFGQVRIGEALFEGPVLPQHLSVTPPAAGGVAPLAGAHAEHWRGERVARPREDRQDLPLSAMRIIDLTMGWAGPLATRQLADLGAEVIKVEGRAHPDWWRTSDYSEASNADFLHEASLYFNVMNRNKIGITLDLTRPEGAEILRRLVRDADVVVENFSQGVLPKLGLDYERLRAEKPDLVMVSMAAFGSNNIWSDVRAYGSTLEHGSGLPSVTGPADGPPLMTHVAYGDPIGGLNAAAAVVAALLHRQRTGEGQFVDLSQVECMFPLVAPWIIEQSVTGQVAPRLGNRHPQFVPHGCFPSDEEDGWVVIAVTDDTAWRSLCEVMDRPDLAANGALATTAGRRDAEDEIEAAIVAWTRQRSADAVMLALQARSVAAGVARGLHEVMLYEPHLQARGFWQEIDRPHIGPHLQPSATFREEGRPYPIRNPSPTLGQSTRKVLSRDLRISTEELDRLEAAHIIGADPIPLQDRAPRSAVRLRDGARAVRQ